MLIVCMLLCACSQPATNTTPPTESASAPTTEAAPPTTQAAASSTAPVQTEPAKLYTNPLTGEQTEQPFDGRPVAVMINNIKAAMPQHGVSQADILYEVLAEGGITRCMGIFTDLGAVEKLGSIRSSRKYYVDILRGYDAWYIHAGASDEALSYMQSIGLERLDGNSNCFYRDQDRLNSGYSSEHTLFLRGEKAVQVATQKDIGLTTDRTAYGLSFDDEAVTPGEPAQKVTVYFNQGGKPGSYTKSTALTYDESTGLYAAAQHGADYIDGNTDETVSFRNILVLHTATSLQSDRKHLTIETTGSGAGYFACNGQIVPILWSRDSVTDPFTYTLEDGTALTLGVGTTYIAVVPTNATVSYE